MAPPKIQLSTLEEDFRRIGLITESDGVPLSKEDSIPDAKPKAVSDEPDATGAPAVKKPAKKAAPGEKPVAEAAKAKSQEKSEDEPEEEAEESEESETPAEESDESEEAEEESEEPAEEETEETEEAEEAEEPAEETDESTEAPATVGEITEAMKLKRKRRLTSKDRLARRKAKFVRRRSRGRRKLKAKQWRRSARGRRYLNRYHQALARLHGHVPQGRRLSLKMGLDHVSNLIEDVKEIVEGIDNDAKQETIKSFANIALISNKLAENFKFACDNLEAETEEGEELDFCSAAQTYEDIAQGAAELAESLNESMQEGVEFEGTAEEVTESFSQMMDAILEGLEVYADLSECTGDEEAPEVAETVEGEEAEESKKHADEDDDEPEAEPDTDDEPKAKKDKGDKKDDDDKDDGDPKKAPPKILFKKDTKKDDADKDDDEKDGDEKDAKENPTK